MKEKEKDKVIDQLTELIRDESVEQLKLRRERFANSMFFFNPNYEKVLKRLDTTIELKEQEIEPREIAEQILG